MKAAERGVVEMDAVVAFPCCGVFKVARFAQLLILIVRHRFYDSWFASDLN